MYWLTRMKSGKQTDAPSTGKIFTELNTLKRLYSWLKTLAVRWVGSFNLSTFMITSAPCKYPFQVFFKRIKLLNKLIKLNSYI